ncbi:hypothetical protein NUW58_g4618 [Xylaria curta]|uniref:Uncharacterized protein n=1 Tax=Xylaria curta TaxID=42375 RepID=A0ACC1P8B5_9PEZI|nr:hypothetical protein NUW58_g4618 [Xylaria curta]
MEDGVYLGVWTNWSRGPIFGATFTTTRDCGNFLISFTAVFIGFVASRFWRIICLGLHRLYSTSQPRDLIYHQRQITLRNATSPEAALWTRIRPVCLLAIICLVAFTIAGVFSASISTAIGDEVLIQSSNCGIPKPGIHKEPTSLPVVGYASELLNNAANYAQQCYNTGRSPPSGAGIVACNKFVVGNLPTASVDYKAICPFDHKLCRTQTSNIRLDTGNIGNDELGFNIPGSDAFSWRYVLQCAPLSTAGYMTRVTHENGLGTVRFHYGRADMSSAYNHTTQDFIWEVDDLNHQYPNKTGRWPKGLNFRLGYIYSPVIDGKIQPGYNGLIPELTRSNGDTTIIFLSGNEVSFVQRMNDDWYKATTNLPWPIVRMGDSRNTTVYGPSVAASPMGCMEQWQWCRKTGPKYETDCGPLAGLWDSLYGGLELFNISRKEFARGSGISHSDPAKSRFLWPTLSTVRNPITLGSMLAQLGTKSLGSQTYLFKGIQLPLPDNQWHLDVTQWWHTILAVVQESWSVSDQFNSPYISVTRLIDINLYTARGIDDPRYRETERPPMNDAERQLSQKIRSAQHTSFSLFGLLFTFFTGTLIIIVSYALEPLLGWLYRRKKYPPYAYFEWTTNASLQLHRLAHEELGLHEFSNCTEKVPVLESNPVLASLDISDLTHPKLSRRERTDDVVYSDTEEEQEVPDEISPSGLTVAEDIQENHGQSGELGIELETIFNATRVSSALYIHNSRDDTR